ncbi:MAG: DUF6338 family protein [Pseudomonadota bacterium]
MADLPTALEITSLVSLLAPGLIISTIRDRAITGSTPDIKERLISYGIISVGYFAAVSPLFHVSAGVTLPRWLWSFLQFFSIPVLVGIALAYIYQWKWSYRIADKFGLRLAHHIPAAWDYLFGSIPAGTFVLVKLKDGTEVPGRMGPNAFASSSKEERDLLIDELYEIDGAGTWLPVSPPRHILLCGNDIRHIEVY